MYEITVKNGNKEEIKHFDVTTPFDLLVECHKDSLGYDYDDLVEYLLPKRSQKYFGEVVPQNQFCFMFHGKLQNISQLEHSLLEFPLSKIHQSKHNVGHFFDSLHLFMFWDGIWKVRMQYRFGKKRDYISWYEGKVVSYGRGMKNPPKYFLKAVELFTPKMLEVQEWFNKIR